MPTGGVPFDPTQLPFWQQPGAPYGGMQLPEGYADFTRPTTAQAPQFRGPMALGPGPQPMGALPPPSGTGPFHMPEAMRGPSPADPRSPAGQAAARANATRQAAAIPRAPAIFARPGQLPPPPPAPPPPPPPRRVGADARGYPRQSSARTSINMGQRSVPGAGSLSTSARQGAGGAGGATQRAAAQGAARMAGTGSPYAGLPAPPRGPGMGARAMSSVRGIKPNIKGGLAGMVGGGVLTAAGQRTGNTPLTAAGQGATYGSIGGGLLGAGAIPSAVVGGAGVGLGQMLSGPATSQMQRQVENVDDRIGGVIPTTWEGARDAFTNPAGHFLTGLGDKMSDTGIPGLEDAGDWLSGKLGAGERDLTDIPLIGGLFGSGGGGEDQAAAQEQAQAEAAQQRAQLTNPDHMASLLTRAGVPQEAVGVAIDEYGQQVEMNLVLNELGQLGMGVDSDGNIVPAIDPETEEPRDDLAPLSDDDVRLLTAESIYSSIPDMIASEAQRTQALERAATFQAILGQTTDPLLAMSQQTAGAFQGAGDPIGAAYANDAHAARAAMMANLPVQMAVDEQMQWDQRIAQIQQEQLLNSLMYPDSAAGNDETLEDITG